MGSTLRLYSMPLLRQCICTACPWAANRNLIASVQHDRSVHGGNSFMLLREEETQHNTASLVAAPEGFEPDNDAETGHDNAILAKRASDDDAHMQLLPRHVTRSGSPR